MWHACGVLSPSTGQRNLVRSRNNLPAVKADPRERWRLVVQKRSSKFPAGMDICQGPFRSERDRETTRRRIRYTCRGYSAILP